jgi:RND family efflux transporter MFP subunit
MSGMFRSDKIGPEVNVSSVQAKSDHDPEHTALAERRMIREFYEAVGTVRPKTETNIEAQITGRILEILVRPGAKVQKGDRLIVLDGRESQTRLDQARQGLSSAKARREKAKEAITGSQAVLNQAKASFDRTKTYFQSEAATSHDLEVAESAYLQALARLKQAEDGLREAEAEVKRSEKVIEQSRVALDYTGIKAPEDGEVVKRLAEPGDLAWPGKLLLVLQTRSELRLEAQIREGLIRHVRMGEELAMEITALDARLQGTVEEIVPSADPTTRTFLVKVGLPDREGLFPGMFGRLLVPVEKSEVIAVPRSAIRRIGQLEVVTVLSGNRWDQVFVKTGRDIDNDMVEILSGLNGGERLELKGDDDV